MKMLPVLTVPSRDVLSKSDMKGLSAKLLRDSSWVGINVGQIIETKGYAVPGDGGGGRYKDVSSEPSHNGKVQSSDGQWWELVPDASGACVGQFGAVGDGVTDDASAISDALEFVSSGGVLRFDAKTYKINSAISQVFDNGAKVRIYGDGAKIDGTAVVGSTPGDTKLITLGGQRVSGSSVLSASPSKGDFAITTTSSIDAVAGEFVLLTSTDLFNSTRSYYYHGEIVEVESVSSNTLNTTAPLYADYTAANTTAHRLQMPSIEVEGLEIEMDANQISLAIEYAASVRVSGGHFHGARYGNVALSYCAGGVVENNRIWDAWYSGTGTSYGVAVSTSQGVVVRDNHITQARHCITAGGNEPCRGLLYSGNFCRMHPSENESIAIDLHGNCQYCSIVNNDTNGIVVAGIDVDIINNRTSGNEPYACIRIYQEIDAEYYRIEGNVVNHLDTTTSAVFLSPSQANLSIAKIVMGQNIVESGHAGITIRPASSSATGFTVEDVILLGNITKAGAAQGFVINNNGAATVTVDRLKSVGNVWGSSAHDGFAVVSTNTVTLLESVGDTFKSNRSGTNTGYPAYFTAVDVCVTHPLFDGGGTDGRSVYYNITGKARVSSPTFVDLLYKAEIGAADDYAEIGWNAATPTVLNTASARLITTYAQGGEVISYGTAAPTANTWAVGDRVVNSSPSVGNPKAWVCTVAGTPGTWVSEGNL